MSAGKVIRWALDKSGMDQHRFAAECGVSRSTLNRWMSGESDYRFTVLSTIAELSGDPEEFAKRLFGTTGARRDA